MNLLQLHLIHTLAGLSHNLILGKAFLKRKQAQLTFKGTTVTLNTKNQGIELVPKNTPLIRNSNDLRFIQVMENDKLKRGNLFRENNELKYRMRITVHIPLNALKSQPVQ